MGNITDIKLAAKLIQLRDSAKSRGIAFDISLAKLRRLMNQKNCYFTAVPFNSINIRSIDRIDTNAGYTDNNIVACTQAINGLKANLTIDQIKGLYKGIVKFEKNKKG